MSTYRRNQGRFLLDEGYRGNVFKMIRSSYSARGINVIAETSLVYIQKEMKLLKVSPTETIIKN